MTDSELSPEVIEAIARRLGADEIPFRCCTSDVPVPVDEPPFELDTEDLRIDVFRSDGLISLGAQTDQPDYAMRITHLPTGERVERRGRTAGESQLRIKEQLVWELTRLVAARRLTEPDREMENDE